VHCVRGLRRRATAVRQRDLGHLKTGEVPPRVGHLGQHRGDTGSSVVFDHGVSMPGSRRDIGCPLPNQWSIMQSTAATDKRAGRDGTAIGVSRALICGTSPPKAYP
jgi:hypothetical protein